MENKVDLEVLEKDIESIRNTKGYPTFIDYGDFAILNREALDIYLLKHYSEKIVSEWRIFGNKLAKIRDILNGEGEK